MKHSAHVTERWKAAFAESKAARMEEGETGLHYAYVRALYYGNGNSGGFKAFYEANYPLGEAESGSYEIISACIEHLAAIGITFSGDIAGKIDTSARAYELTQVLMVNTHALLHKLVDSRHQYGIGAQEAINKCSPEMHKLADLENEFSGKSPAKKPKQKLNNYVTIPENYLEDPFIKDLWEQVEHTRDHFFITGKAGTGKSTFLHFLARNTKKNVIITAFTGIAAINIGGTTLHSFFRFPFRPMLPHDEEIPVFSAGSYKRKIIKQMDALVIDEVSMVRADIMEALDHSLRINGGDRKKPFGGKQLILIGDLFQLPPVVKVDNNVEWQIFEDVYDSPYFFSSHTFKVTPFNFIEMPKIYRQNDQNFKDLLNNIRVGNVDEQVLKPLNKRQYPDYEPRQDEFVLTLVTTNKLANSINQRKLRELKAGEFVYKAVVDGDFSSDRYPTDEKLKLKEGAQIIFIKNDINQETGQKRRWVNGTIAKIHSLAENEVHVEMEDGQVHKIEPESWENRLYKFDPRKRRITSEVIGTFMQYPVKLAWAITIHKSQGLTFERLHLNTGYGAFAHGQTYVALSRCRSLEGLTLKNPVRREDIILDKRVMRFYRKHFVDKDAYMRENEIINLILQYPAFFTMALALHYPFSGNEIIQYQKALPFGKTWYSYFDEEKQQAVYSDFGLVFNQQIHWQEFFSKYRKHVNAKKKEVQRYIPLHINKELDARLDAITREAMVRENYKKAGKKAEVWRNAKAFLEQEAPQMSIQDLQKVLKQKQTLQYQLSGSFFKNNIGNRLTPDILRTVMDYLAERKIVKSNS